MNILVSALGANPVIIKETIALFNYSKKCDIYEHNADVKKLRGNIDTVQEIWLIATDQVSSIDSDGKHRNSTEENYIFIKEQCANYGANFRIFILKGVPDIVSSSDARCFHDLTLRVVLYAKQIVGDNGKLYLSLACGRKTMSTDMQDAAYCFGCDQLIHVLGDTENNAQPILLGSVPKNESLQLNTVSFESEEKLYCEPQTSFLEDVENKKREAQHFYTSYYMNEEDSRSNFHILYTLPPSKIHQLKNEYIGIDKEKEKAELNWLKQLPKTDLHCHLGGVLHPKDIVECSYSVREKLKEIEKTNELYSEYAKVFLHQFVQRKEYTKVDNWKDWISKKNKEVQTSKGIVTATLSSCFFDNWEEFFKEIYGEYIDETKFCAIGFNAYEKLGDIQGSSLLDSELMLKETLMIFLNKCVEENVKYVELRCSPINYVREEFPAVKVVTTICDVLSNVKDVEVSLIFIVSRHREDLTKQYVELVNKMKGNKNFERYFRGFDVAGNESEKSPQAMRNSFIEIMKDCYNITIHAGEDQPVENIWEAVYHLNAERIGHGLTLEDNEELLNKFLQRGIGIEMCPSSNYQIVGYSDNYYKKETAGLKKYPLKKYLEKELMVSINTDDPGISLTDMTHELHKAARMTDGGLSKWEILQLICNGFRTVFYPYEKKRNLIKKAERNLGELIKKDLL